MISVSHPSKILKAKIPLPASKSISNRLLVIHYLMNHSFKMEHLSKCNDTIHLQKALSNLIDKKPLNGHGQIIIDVGEAGTSFRFLAALLCTTSGNYELRGTEKLMQRPISALVEALKSLGANISQPKTNGPLYIIGTELEGGKVVLDASTSSQYITALMLVAPYFKQGLNIELTGKIVSFDYIKMTMRLMQQFGATVEFENQTVHVNYGPYKNKFESFQVESDWTAASYWYAFAVLSTQCNIYLKGLCKDSLQGDRLVADLFYLYGIKSEFNEAGVTLTKSINEGFIAAFDFIDNPDLVQTFAFLNASLGLPLQINNAVNLKVKETDRIAAILFELKKIGGHLTVKTDDDFCIESKQPALEKGAVFETYKDHRMAMSAAILVLHFNQIKINDEQVVSKSYPAFWEHLKLAGFEIEKQ